MSHQESVRREILREAKEKQKCTKIENNMKKMRKVWLTNRGERNVFSLKVKTEKFGDSKIWPKKTTPQQFLYIEFLSHLQWNINHASQPPPPSVTETLLKFGYCMNFRRPLSISLFCIPTEVTGNRQIR